MRDNILKVSGISSRLDSANPLEIIVLVKTQLTENQTKAIESIDKSMLVVAGAGSGKTLVLVHRFVEILQKNPNLSVSNLLAVTYTTKAAKEMRTRIKARLKELYEEAKKEGRQDQLRWHKCLADMDLANINTIHSLCQSILRSFTVEIGLDPQIEILDEIETAQIMQESVAETLRQIIASDDYDKSVLQHFSLDTIAGFLETTLKNHLRFKEITAPYQGLSTEELIEKVEYLLTNTQKQLLIDLLIDDEWLSCQTYIQSPFPDPQNKLEETRRQICNFIENLQEQIQSFKENEDKYFQNTKIKEAWSTLLQLAEFGSIRVGGNADSAKQMRLMLKSIVQKGKEYSHNIKAGFGLPLTFASTNGKEDEYWRFWQNLLTYSKLALSIYSDKKLEAGKLDFDDLIAKTQSVLKSPDYKVRQYYNNLFKHILVDEFQDTNSIQAEIITLLAGPDTKLFLIGDDKQSIYKFQGADVSIFNAWQNTEIDSLIFEHSFRSSPYIVNFVNKIFSQLLPAAKAHVSYRAKYSALIAQRQPSPELQNFEHEHDTSVEIVRLPELAGFNDDQNLQNTGDGLSPSALSTHAKQAEVNIGEAPPDIFSDSDLEGKAVAKWIFDKVQNGTLIENKDGKRKIDFGDFAILTARNNDLPIFESYLSELNIPYVTFGGRTFLERQEIYDLENMLLFLSNPSDSHALLAALRSPMFALSDEIIHNMITNTSLANSANEVAGNFSGPKSLWQFMQSQEKNNTTANAAEYQPVVQAVKVIKRLLEDMPSLTLTELIYRIIRDTNYDTIALSLPDGKQRYKNIWKFYMLAKDEYSATEFTDRLALSRQLSISQANATLDNKHAVKLMTIHAAKGLEFPAVALPFLSNPHYLNKPPLLFHGHYGIVLNIARTESEKEEGISLPYQLGKILDDDMDLAEKKRLLYVAMTRARDYLGLFISNRSSNKSAAAWLEPVLDDTNNAYKTCSPALSEFLTNNRGHAIKRTEIVDKPQETGILPPDALESLLESANVSLGVNSPSLPDIPLAHRVTPSSNQSVNAALLGKFFHRIMEYLPKDKTDLQDSELTVLLEQFAEEVVHPAIKKILLEEGKKLLSVYADSQLHQIFSKAKNIFHEWPYYVSVDNDQLKLNRPDILLETEQGEWYLIDYKTDRFVPEDIEQHAMRHRSQLERYGKDFASLTNIQPKLAIYFAQIGKLHEIT